MLLMPAFGPWQLHMLTVYIFSCLPALESGIAPIDIQTKIHWEQHQFHDFHVWDCSVYVLDKTIADGKKIPHWKPHSTSGIFMGFSPDQHASTVPLVLNPESRAVTPQFNVVFDDWFATIGTSINFHQMNG
jgi:hypothetical protein